MTPVSHGKPCAGNPHARFDEGASAPEKPRRNALLHKRIVLVVWIVCVGLMAQGGRMRMPLHGGAALADGGIEGTDGVGHAIAEYPLGTLSFGAKNLIGPGHIELHVSSNLVYGVFSAEDDFEGRWFAIERDTQKTYVRERPEAIESVLKTHNEGLMRTNTSGSFFKTFQSLRDDMAHE